MMNGMQSSQHQRGRPACLVTRLILASLTSDLPLHPTTCIAWIKASLVVGLSVFSLHLFFFFLEQVLTTTGLVSGEPDSTSIYSSGF